MRKCSVIIILFSMLFFACDSASIENTTEKIASTKTCGQCDTGSSCVNGQCVVDKNQVDVATGVKDKLDCTKTVCDTGMSCEDGICVPIQCQQGQCKESEVCEAGKCRPLRPCEINPCTPDSVCLEEGCVNVNSCKFNPCEESEICENDQCRPKIGCEINPCTPDSRCVQGRCEKV